MNSNTNKQQRAQRVLISGALGQDGSLLTRKLASLGHEVFCGHGPVEASRMVDWEQYVNHADIVRPIVWDITNTQQTLKIITEITPDVIFNFAAFSSVLECEQNPGEAHRVNITAYFDLLEAVRHHSPSAHVVQPGSSEMYSLCGQTVIDEATPLAPKSLYGFQKALAYRLGERYAAQYGTRVSNAVLFNHESRRRPLKFVSAKIADHVRRYARGEKAVLRIGNLNIQRDWSHASDVIDALWLISQQPVEGNYVVSSCESHSLSEFVEVAFAYIGIIVVWTGKDEKKRGYCSTSGELLVETAKEFYRDERDVPLVGNATRIKEISWNPRYNFSTLVRNLILE